MKKRIYHIIATPREDESRTLKISSAFLESFQTHHPEYVYDELNLAKEPLPSLSHKRVDGKYMLLEGKNLYGETRELWTDILTHIERFKTADLYLLSVPMWNFTIPYYLKQYIDVIVQPKYLFQYHEGGQYEGLLKNKKMVIAVSRGGAYPSGSEYDFQIPYLKAIFGFVGITDIRFLVAEPMDTGHLIRDEKLKNIVTEAKQLGEEIDA